MKKIELATAIAKGILPEHYHVDSPAVQGEIKNLMKKGKSELMAIAEHGGVA